MSEDEIKVNIEVTDISKERILSLALEAHDLDITLNEHCTNIIKEGLDELQEESNK